MPDFKIFFPDVLILHGKAWELGADLAQCFLAHLNADVAELFFI